MCRRLDPELLAYRLSGEVPDGYRAYIYRFQPRLYALPVTDDDNRQRYRVDVLSRHTLNVYLRDRLELPKPRG